MKRRFIPLFFLIFLLNNFLALSADRYFVYSNGDWSDTANWSTSSGGPSGASVPSDTDDVFFDNNSFLSSSDYVQIFGVTAYCRDMDWTGVLNGIRIFGSSSDELHIFGSLKINTNVVDTTFDSHIYFRSNNPGKSVYSNGHLFRVPVHFAGTGGVWTLQDAFSSKEDVYLDTGSFITNSFNFSCNSFYGTNSNTRSLSLGGSTVSIASTWNFTITTGLTFSAGTSVISFANVGAGNFRGGGLTYYNLSASNVILLFVYGSNIFTSFSVATPPSGGLTLTLEASSTQTILNSLVLNGISSNRRVKIRSSSSPTKGNFSKASGKICCDWLDLKDNNGGGGASYFAGVNSINTGNVSGWSFTTCPPPLTISLAKTDVACNSGCNGTATVTAIPGTPPYTYLWNTGETTSSITGLCIGIYLVTVIDWVPDTVTGSVTITEPVVLTASITSYSDIACNSQCNGSETVTASGGTIPYTYSWNTAPAQTTSTATGLCATIAYFVTVTDNNGCTATAGRVLTQPAVLNTTISSSVNASCFGICDGQATATVSGGTVPYTYDWDDPGSQTGSIATGLCDGTYNVLVTDANGCQDPATVTITEPAPITVNITSFANISCNGKCNGTATAVAAGGAPAYTYVWNNGEKGASADSLCAGNDIITVTDSRGCTATDTVTLTEPPPLTSGVSSVLNITCFGLCNGSATVNPSGGTPPYTYLWSGGACTSCQTNTILCAVTYFITVTDNNSCTTTNSTSLTQPPPVTADIVNSANANCFGSCTGFADVQASGGIPPYTFLWSDPASQTNDTATGLCAGFYTVTVSDNNGCDTTDTVSIIEPQVITTTTNVSCSGICDGIAVATPNGGVPPYTFQWYDSIPWSAIPGETDSLIDSLCTGSYCLVTTDNNGCLDTNCFTITLPTITTSDTLPSCPGDCDGKIVVTAIGGSPPYTYEWRDTLGNIIDTDSILTNVCAGKYYINIINSIGCVLMDSVYLIDPTWLTASIAGITNVLCAGQCNGSASVTPSGGSPPFTFLWSNGNTTPGATGLCAGGYFVTVTDAKGCDTTIAINITQPPLLTINFISVNNVTCGGACDGNITATGSGGTPPYTYNWSNGQTGGSAINLCPNTFTVTVTDNKGCTATKSGVITEPAALTLSVSKVDVSCNGVCTGQANAIVGGGTVPYTFEWNDPLFQTTSTATGLCAATYSVTVTDANLCTKTASVTITQPTPLTAVISSSVNPVCGGQCNGQATVSPGGGTPSYTYLWTDGQTTALALNLCEGSNTVTVTDNKGCTTTATAVLTAPPTLVAAITDSTSLSCNAYCDGDATVTASGGTPPYSYLWTGGQSDSIATGLCAGTFSVTVTDTKGCTALKSVLITQPSALAVNITAPAAACAGLCNVTATTASIGGTPPYTYQWDDLLSQTGSSATGLCADTFGVTVSDANGCSGTDGIIITEPLPLLVDTFATSTVGCFGDCSGDAEVFASGGTPAYTYQWNNGDTGPLADTLCSQVYTVTVTDANACTATLNVPVTGPNGLSASIQSSSDASCYGVCDGVAEVQATGGAPPYTYQWRDGLGNPIGVTDTIAAGLCDGKYVAEITDNNGCVTMSDTSFITEPLPFSASISSYSDISCNAICDGTAGVTASGGISPFTYLWVNGDTSTAADTLCSGVASVTVTDASGCTSEASVILTEPSALSATFSNSPATCNGLCDGQSTATPSGGTPPYSYLWSNSDTSSAADTLCAGSVLITITDNKGCTYTSSESITEPALLLLAFTDTTSSTCSACNGDATVSAGGGNAPYTFDWSNGDADAGVVSSSADSLCVSTYSVTVTDANGCTDQMNVVVAGPGNLSSSVSDTTHESCPGACDGGAVAAVSGGLPPYTYQWYDQAGNLLSSGYDTIINRCPGNDTLHVLDNTGCLTTVPFPIYAAPLMNFTDTAISDIACYGNCTGSISVTHSPGTPPYTYIWMPGSVSTPTPDISSLCSGSYSLQVEDGNGCLASLNNISVTEPPQFSLTATTNAPACNGSCDGDATVAPSGGTPPYTFLWSTGDVTAMVDTLCAGNYDVTVTDNNGCSATLNVAVTDPGILAISSFITTNPGCKDSCDGSSSVVAAGGSGFYSYLWSNGETPAAADSLCDGIYSVTVTDLNGCGTVTGTDTISEPPAIGINITSVNIICGGECTGQATVNAGGGSPPYSFLWSQGGSTSQTITGLCAGNYTVTVTDTNGCTDAKTKIITENAPLVLSLFDTATASCGVCDGMAQVVATGGVPAYSYQWDASAGSQTTETATGLCASSFTVTTTDANGCTDMLTVIITGPNGLTSQVTDTVNVSCFGACDGGATVTVSGGYPPYTHQWYNVTTSSVIPGATDTFIIDLCAGTYADTINDNTGCKTIAPVTITEPQQFSVAMTDSTDISCSGNCTGSATVTVTGGITPYTYDWSNGDTGSTITGLCAGTYTVTVTSSGGCGDSILQVTINAPQTLTTSMGNSVNISCYGYCDGIVEINTSGGVMPYTFQWNPAIGTSTDTLIDSLCSGTYRVTITDVNGCSGVDSVSLTDPGIFIVSITDSTMITCNGMNNGSATAAVTGGAGSLTYLWDNGDTTLMSDSLDGGNHCITVTDSTGCVQTACVNIIDPAVLQASIINVVNVTCNGLPSGSAEASAFGGTPPYSYLWNISGTDSIADTIFAGDYYVTITDANGCTDSASVSITDSSAMTLNVISQSNITCTGFCDGSIEILPTLSVPPYTYSWSNSDTDSIVTALCAGNYGVTVISASNCVRVKAFILTQPDTLLDDTIINIVNTLCVTTCNGSATTVVSGGIPPYTYLWDNNDTTATDSALCAGTGYITITDSSNCVITDSVVILGSSPLTVTYDTTSASCNNTADGAIDLTVSGGITPYTYLWSNADTTEDITGIAYGTYTVTISDSVSCTEVDTFNIVPLLSLQVSAGSDSFICKNDSVMLAGSTPDSGVTFTWYLLPDISTAVGNDSSIKTAPPDSVNNYMLAISKGGCTMTDTVTVFAKTLPVPNASASDTLILKGYTTTLSASGGGNYVWSSYSTLNNPIVSSPIASPLTTTAYFVVVTSANGCSSKDSITITVIDTLIVPNAITPNGDGKNDYWNIPFVKDFPDISVEVYNRWGEQVFESKKGEQYANKFEGKYNNELLPAGTYYFIINFGVEKYKPLTGTITIMQ